MVWLEGLANIQLGRVVEFLESIASGDNVESRHFRVLGAWASISTAPLRPDVVSLNKFYPYKFYMAQVFDIIYHIKLYIIIILFCRFILCIGQSYSIEPSIWK